MSIEVKQMIIKSTLVDDNREREDSGSENPDIESLKQQLMEECREMIEQILQKSRER